MAVPFHELDNSPSEEYSARGIRHTRRILVPWARRKEFLGEVLGSGFLFGNNPGVQYPGQPGVRAVRVHFEPFHDDIKDTVLTDISADLASYETFAVAVINYDWLQGQIDDPPVEDGWLTYRIDFAADGHVLPGRGLFWNSGGGDRGFREEDKFFIKRLPILEHHLTWHRVVSPPYRAIRKSIGTLNKAEFLGANIDTLLFDGASLDTEFLIPEDLGDPKQTWALTYLFREKRIIDGDGAFIGGWNYAYRSIPAGEAGWHEVVDSAGSKVYGSTDFENLIKYEEADPPPPDPPDPPPVP